MARGSTLAQVRQMVNAELGDSLVTTTKQTSTLINRRIVQTQLWLSNEYKWPFLFGSFDVSVSAGQRFPSIPATLNLDNSTLVSAKWNLLWNPVVYGIGPHEYNIYDSERGIQSSPITRWKEYNGTPHAAGTMTLEVWPIPSTAQTLRLEGQRVLNVLPSGLTDNLTTDDSKILELDDLLLAYFVAAEFQAGKPNYNHLAAKAQARFNKLRAESPIKHTTFPLGRESNPSYRRETIVRITPTQL